MFVFKIVKLFPIIIIIYAYIYIDLIVIGVNQSQNTDVNIGSTKLLIESSAFAGESILLTSLIFTYVCN